MNRKRTTRRERPGGLRTAHAHAEPAPSLSLRHPAALFVLAVAIVCGLVAVSFVIYDTDLWTLLVYGKAIWTLPGIPTTDLWTWRHWGEPQVTSSWGFRALLWPVWTAAGVWGLYGWRWATALAVFGFAGAAGRRLGARVPLLLVALVWWVVIFRSRSHVRPETLAFVLLAVELWILETHRAGGPDRRWWLVGLAALWPNVHISYHVGLLVQGIYAIDAALGRRRGAVRRAGLVLLASAAASFANPWGWKPLWEPFEFLLFWRNDPMFRGVGELTPVPWQFHLRNPDVFLPWPVLLLWRAWKRRAWDVAEVLACVIFTALPLSSIRFHGFYAVVATPFFARDLQAFVDSWRWPAWTRPPWTRAVLAALACVAIAVPAWMRPEPPLGIGFQRAAYPVAACDFLARHDIGGRVFNQFHLAGYLLYRFWPERTRLAFLSTQPEHAAPEDRRLYEGARTREESWRELERRYRFDYILLDRDQQAGDRMHDFVDRDTSFVLVFADDAAEVLVRRQGRYRGVAERYGYAVLPAGRERRERLIAAAGADPALRGVATADVRRQLASSPENGQAHYLLGVFALMEERLAEGRAHLEEAVRKIPQLKNAHWLLGLVALRDQRPRDALRHFQRERRFHEPPPGFDWRLGEAYEQLGDARRARAAYRRELARDPAHAAAAAALRKLGG